MRPFRLVATTTAADMGTALVQAALTLGAARETATAQLEAETAKGDSADRATIAQLQRQAADAHRSVGEARAAVLSIFQGIAAARFRDVCADVRAAVITAVGGWIALDAATYLSDAMLKYLAWALSDRDARVRGAALDALNGLYSRVDCHSALRTFTDRFSARFADLVHDVDDGVAAKGVDLVSTLVRAGEMDAAAAGRAFRLLTDPSPAVRAAAADLVAGLLAARLEKEDGEGEEGGGRSGRRGRGRRTAAPPTNPGVDALLDVLATLATPDDGDAGASSSSHLDPDTVDVVVAALADRVPALADFPALAASLSEDAAEARGEPGATNAVLLVAAAVKAAATKGARSARAPRGAPRPTISSATAALAPVLPDLLARYGTDAVKAGALVSTLAWLDLGRFAAGRGDTGGLPALLRRVADIAGRVTDAATVRACARALARCAESGPGGAREAAADVLAEAFDNAADAADAATDAVVAGKQQRRGGADAAATASAAWTRAAALALVAPPPAAAGDSLEAAARRVLAAAGSEGVPADVVAAAAAVGLATLLWRLRSVGDADARAAASLGASAASFAECLGEATVGGGGGAAASALADLLLAFSPAAAPADSPAAAAAAVDPPAGAVAALLSYCDRVLKDGEGGKAPGAPDLTPAEAAALMLARLVAYNAVDAGGDAAVVLLSHAATSDLAAAAASREGVRALRRGAGIPVDTWAKAFVAAAGRGAGDLASLTALVSSAPPGSAACIGALTADAIERAVEIGFETPATLANLTPLTALAARVPYAEAARVAPMVRAAADRAARRGLGVGAAGALHAVADALSRRAAGGGAPAPRSALRRPSSTGQKRDRRISFAGGDEFAASESDDDDEGTAAGRPATHTDGPSADALPTLDGDENAMEEDDSDDDDDGLRRPPRRL